MSVRPTKYETPSECHKVEIYLEEYCKTSNIHGIHYLTEKRSRAERVFWLFVLLLSLSGCTFMIHKIWKKYQTSPIVVSFATKDTAIYEIPFPAVTICPESKCAQSKFNYSAVYDKLRKNHSVSDMEFRNFIYFNILCDNTYNELLIPLPLTVDNEFFAVIDKLKPDFKMMCHFTETDIDCEGMLTTIITDQGICYTINIVKKTKMFRDNVIYNKNIYDVQNNDSGFDDETTYLNNADAHAYPARAFMSGVDNSLNLFIMHTNSDGDNTCTFRQGYRVLIHSPLDIPRLSKNYFRVSHDEEVMVAVQPDLILTSDDIKNFSPDKRKCYFKNERSLKYFLYYSQSNCYLECLTNYTLSECGCVSYFMPFDNQTSVCGPGSDSCLEDAKKSFKYQELEIRTSDSDKSICDCKPSCNNLRYDVETSKSVFFYEEYVQFFKKMEDTSNLYEGEKYSHIIVYFKSDHFMSVMRKELYGVSDLISNFGGLLGLFTGFSLISAVEIIYFLTLRPYGNIKIFGQWWGSTQ